MPRALGHRLPEFIARKLFGHRSQWGIIVQPEDRCWQEWEKTYLSFYDQTQ